MRDALFANDSLREFLLGRLRSVRTAVARCSDDQVLTDPEAVAKIVLEQLDVPALSVDWDSKRVDPIQETTIVRKVRDGGQRVVGNSVLDANKVTWHVKYTGDFEVLSYKASTYQPFQHEARAVGNEIVYSVELPRGEPATEFRAQAARVEAQITESVAWANADIEAWRPNLVDAVKRAIADRAKHLQNQQELATALNIPLHRSPEEQAIPIPVTRRTIAPTPDKAPVAAEPAITQAIYEDIVGTLRRVGNSFERLPRTAEKFDEEELRDVLLFILNSNYEGSVAGEVFNGDGKTDLLLRWRDRNAFIGECKIWKGPKAFADAIDQLLGYTVWRDTKAALVLFIRDGNPSEIIEKADREIRKHSCFIRAVESPEPDGRRNYIMHASDDPAREIQLALLPIVVRQKS